MTLEEAQAKITDLMADIQAKDTEIGALKKDAGKVPTEDELKKRDQKAYNQGFDKAKNQYEDEKKDYLKKEDVDKMLKERDDKYKVKTELLTMGIKNPDKALKIIDEEDLKTFGTSEFKPDDFKEKYSDVLVFKLDGEQKPPKHKVITKENEHGDTGKITADSYGDLSPSEKAKLSPEDKLALLKD